MNVLGIDNAPAFVLLAVRLGGLVVAAPVFGSPPVPPTVRAAMALGLAFVFAPLAGVPATEWTAGSFALAALGEAGVGLLLGFTASLLFAAVRLAGHLVDQDAGLALAGTLDPNAEEGPSPVARFQSLLALVLYLLINGHHVLIGSVIGSFRVIPVGGGIAPAGATPALVADMAGRLFVLGMNLAIPALATLFLVTVAMAFLARAVPDLNLLTLGYPLRALVGMGALAVGVGIFARAFARAAADQERMLSGLLAALGGRP